MLPWLYGFISPSVLNGLPAPNGFASDCGLYGLSRNVPSDLEESRLSDRPPPTRICALLAVQDRTFFRHHGIGLLDGPPLHTTVTQSISKGLFFRRFSPGPLRYRKLMLMMDAWAFDLRIPKQKQLRIFMNRAFLGNKDGAEVLGFEAAAKTYFARGILEISDREYRALVCMLLAPNTYHVVNPYMWPCGARELREKGFMKIVSRAPEVL